MSARAGRGRRKPTSRPANLSLADKRRLVTTALELIDRLYVHLPLKRSMYAVNPGQRLRLLLRRLDGRDGSRMPDRAFFDAMLGTFAELRDLHTTFVLPEPLRSTTAYLPFTIEPCRHRGREEFVVSHVLDEGRRPGFDRGVVITHWNGIPIARAVALNAERELGSNPAARRAQGVASMTMRWLGQSLPPDEEWVDIRCRPGDQPRKQPIDVRFEWRAFSQDTTALGHGVARAQGAARRAVGMDERGEVERQIRQELFARRMKGPASRVFGYDKDIVSRMPDVFPACRDIATRGGLFGYLRIATFNVERDEPFLREFIRLVGRLSPRGLILDVRGNGGGLITAGERLLQLLTPNVIEPARFHLLNTPRTAQLARSHAFLRAWTRSIDQSVETGTDFSQGLPLLPTTAYNDLGQRYHGPVVLIVDALCYSTTDIFAAGFQDHRIGPILGIDEATGAGGANVWEYDLIAHLARDPNVLPPRLPKDSSFRFAVRRVTRVGENAGLPLEDLGVRPDVIHRMTRRDVLERNVDLIQHAATLLAKRPWQHLSVIQPSAQRCRITCAHVDTVDVYLGDHPLESRRVTNAPLDVRLPHVRGRRRPELRVMGFRGGTLVAARRLKLR